MSLRTAFRSFLFFVLLAGLATGAWAQATTSLRGIITDPAGAIVAGARLTLTNVGTAAVRQTQTDPAGGYLFASLPPGTYRLQVESRGFKTVVREDIELQVNLPVTLNIALELGQVSEVVSVTSEAPLLNTSDATVGNVITNNQIVRLPLEARNIMSLLSLQTGVTLVVNTEDGIGTTPDYRNGTVNGAKSDQANITLDGVDANDQLNGYVNGALRLTVDSLQEFRMTTASPTATQGRSSGAQIAMVTRSGTNNWHGTAYEFHRNTRGSANDWFLNAAKQPRRKYLKNVFGTSLGGPIKKDRFFTFLNYEGRRDRQEISAVRIVPSMDLRNGFLSYRNTAGGVTRMTPDDIKKLDPGGIGPSPAVMAVFQQYPVPNDSTVGDGFNRLGFRWRAPAGTDLDTWIAKFDYKLTSDGRHSLFWRGNLQADTGQGTPQFPGQAPQFKDLNNSRASAVGYTAVLRPTLVNDFRWGFTRQGVERAGISTSPTVVQFRNFDDLIPTTIRSNGRRLPTHNLVDDLTWVKGSHTLNFGGNLRWVRRESYTLATSYHNAVTNSSWLIGTGSDLRAPDVTSAFRVAMSDSMIALLGIIPFGNGRYNYDRTGKPLALGAPVNRRYGANEYEWYLQDAWKLKPNLTVTLGVRHSLFSPPWETNGNQVAPSFSLGKWFDLRGGLMQQGQPSTKAPVISFDLAGPANGGKRGFYDYDKNNFAPRLAIVYSPGFRDGFLSKLTGGPGKTSIRMGYSVAYDHIGQGLANTFDTTGAAFGMGTALQNQSSSLSSKTAPRFVSLTFIPPQVLLPAPPGGFPATPQPSTGKPGSGAYLIQSAIDDTIKTPYSQMVAFSVERLLPKNFVFEIGYVGRFSRKVLIQDELAMPLDLYDPASQTTYFQAANIFWNLMKAGVKVADVGKIPYWENLFPALATSTRSATQVLYNDFLGNGPDVTSFLNDVDVICSPGCSKFGPYALFNDQYSALAAWRSRATGNYNALQVSLRKRLSAGLQFDMNFTWSKSIDWASVRESAGTYSGFTVNSWSPGLRRSVSDYDLTRQLNMNGIYELPFGKGKRFAGGVNRAVDAIIGGWQLGGIYRHTSGLPISVGNGRFWPTNWNITGSATAIKPFPETGTIKNAPSIGGPNMFPDWKDALSRFDNTRPGQVGDRNQLRGDGLFNIDLNLGKTWKMPYKEGHRLQFRWEVFNITNSVRYDVQSISNLDLGAGAANFGKYSGTLTQPRVMQFALRYEF